MKFLSLLGKMLKDDEMIDILESLDMTVIYEFDRLHEGQPDVYWAAAKPDGFQLRFDEKQHLDAIFLHITPDDGYAAISQHDCDIPFFATRLAAESFAEAKHMHVEKGGADFLEINREWVRIEFASHSIHYEYHGTGLALVTITRKDEGTA